jgi:hypothetical protein
MKLKQLLLSAYLMLGVSVSAQAAQINQQLTCYAQLTHVKNKLPVVSDHYASSDIGIIKKGVNAYQQYLQSAHIEPGMKQFPTMQAQVDAMQKAMVQKFDERYPQPRYFMDHAVMLNNCYKQYAPTKAQGDEAVQAMIKKIAEVAKQSG